MGNSNIYNFSLVYHDDIVLENNNVSYNFGYNFNSKLPILLFLNYKQLTGKNLFNEIILPEISNMPLRDSNLEFLLEESLESSKKLPTENLMDLKIATFRFNHFTNGNFKIRYEFELVGDDLILSNNGPSSLIDLKFNTNQLKSFLQSYVDFVFLEEKLKLTQLSIKRTKEVFCN